MTLREILLAFLAARYPTAYTTPVLTQRVNSSALLDARITERDVSEELTTLCKKFGWLDSEVTRINGVMVWMANTEGVKQWHLDGQLHVG